MFQFYFGNLCITFIISLIAFLIARKYRGLKEQTQYFFFSLFWLSLSLAYLIVFLENINILLKYPVDQMILYYTIQAVAVVLGFTILAALTYGIFSNKKTANRFMIIAYTPLSLIFAWILIKHPPQKIINTEWVIEFQTHPLLKQFLFIMVIYIVTLIIINLMKKISQDKITSKYNLVVSGMALTAVFVSSVIDEIGILTSWTLVLNRLIIMIGVIAIFLTVPIQDKKIEIENK